MAINTIVKSVGALEMWFVVTAVLPSTTVAVFHKVLPEMHSTTMKIPGIVQSVSRRSPDEAKKRIDSPVKTAVPIVTKL